MSFGKVLLGAVVVTAVAFVGSFIVWEKNRTPEDRQQSVMVSACKKYAKVNSKYPLSVRYPSSVTQKNVGFSADNPELVAIRFTAENGFGARSEHIMSCYVVNGQVTGGVLRDDLLAQWSYD